MPKNKPNKGLLKRIRVTKSGKVKLSRAFGRHLRSHKSGKTMRGYRRHKYAAPAEVKRSSELYCSNCSPLAWRFIKKGELLLSSA